MVEDKMVKQNNQLNGHEFKQTSGDSFGQGSPADYSPWGDRVGHDLATEQQLQQILSSLCHSVPSSGKACDIYDKTDFGNSRTM